MWFRNAAMILMCGVMTLALGCNNKPPESAQKAVVYDEPAKEAAPTETPAEAPAPVETPAPAETPAAPAPTEASDEWDQLEVGSISGKQDIGLDAAPAPAPAETPAPAPSEAPAAAATGDSKTYVIEPNDDSFIDFVGYKVTGGKSGGFANFTGKVDVPGGDITKGKVEVSVDLATVFSEAGALTEKLKSADFFDVEKFPKATFVSDVIEKAESGYIVKGQFDLHGVKHGMGFPVNISIEGDTLKATSEFTIDRNDWGISYAGVTDDLIKAEVLIKFEVVAKAE